MASNWKIFGRKRDEDTEFLNNDYQPQIPSSRINLEHRFGLQGVSRSHDIQYENWTHDTVAANDILSNQPLPLEKIYENQLEMLDNNLSRLRDCSSSAPPLPPRNTPSRHHQPTTPTSYHTIASTTPSRHHHNTTINIDTSTTVGCHNHTIAASEDEMDTNDIDENDNLPIIFPKKCSKYQSQSSSALHRFSVRPFSNVTKHTFNETFSSGDNIYSNMGELSEPALLLQGKRLATSRFLKMSSHKLTQAVQGCKTAIASMSQKFRSSTQRRYRLDSRSPRPGSLSTPPHGSIRRTPGKLYSPFLCNTPPPPRGHDAKRLQHKHNHRARIGQENRTPRTPRSQLLNTTTPEYSVHSRLSMPGNELQKANSTVGQRAQLASTEHQRGFSGIVGHRTSLPRHQYSNAASFVREDPPKALLSRNLWSSFHTSRPQQRVVATVDQPSTIANQFEGRCLPEYRPAVSAPLQGDHGQGVPPVPPARRPDVFQRHMVEFDQMSRNITISLSRNAKFRNSIR